MAPAPGPDTDIVLPFQVEGGFLRGRLVRLGPILDEILRRHDYPEPVSRLLGELVLLTATLGSALKYDGVFTLQVSAKGPVSILVADMTSAGELRAYAQFDAERLAALAAADPDLSPVPALLGAGHLAFTVDQGADTERYQGIVGLEGSTLTDCIHHYFRQSEQLDAAIKLALARDASGDWLGGALMVQRLPGPSRADEIARAEAEEGWREALALMASARSAELTDAALAPDRLLYRLFHKPGVRAFTPHIVRAGCRCSRARVERTLASFPREEVLGLMVDGAVAVKCEFCGEDYTFDRGAIEALFAA